MKAFVLSRYGSASIGDVPLRAAGARDVVIRVHAAGLNPVDYKTRDGKLKIIRDYPLPIAMGNELAGVVDAVGASVTRFKPGDRVCARVDKTWMGALAELCPVDEAFIAHAPKSVELAAAAALPLAGLTALQVLRDELKVHATPGARVLITGGAGGVGTYAVQLARHLGAHVTTTASPRGRALVESLGAHEIVDYTTTSLEQYAQTHGRTFDCAFDTVGGDACTGAMANVKKGGAVVSIAAMPEPKTARVDLGLGMRIAAVFWLASFGLRRRASANGVTYRYLFMKPDGAQLAELVALVDDGKLKTTLDRTFPFAQTADAIAYLEQGRAKGKVVVTMDDAK
jgi:NADPH:quinone reductase-like Zn-dependent oxidoreductase